MKDTTLLIVDVQTALVAAHPYREDLLLKGLERLVSLSRKNGTEIIYVRHDGGAGDELAYGTPGWKIEPRVQPAEGEKIFEKRFNSAFRQTGLKEYLDQRGIQTLILTGMQTEYCFDVTCKVAFEYGYRVIIPQECVTTFDNPPFPAETLNNFYLHTIWHNRYAQVQSLAELEAKFYG